MNKKVGVLVAAVAVVAFAGGLSLNAVRASGSSSTATKAEVRLQATGAATGATGATGAIDDHGVDLDQLGSGKAKSEQRTDRTRFSVELEDLSGTGTYSVHISDASGEIANSPVSVEVDAFGFGELELNTRDGSVNVPVALAGDVVEVRNAGGVLVFSGTLAPKQ